MGNIYILIIFGLLPNIVLSTTYERFEYPKALFFYITVSIVFLSILLRAIKSKGSKVITLSLTIFDFFLIFFTLILALSTVFSISPYASLLGMWNHSQGGLLFFLAAIFFYYYLYIQDYSEKKLQKIVFVTVLGMVCAVLWGLLSGEIKYPFWETIYRMRSTQGNPIYFGSYVMLGLPLIIGFLIKKKIWIRVVALLLATVILFGLILSFTRSAWIVVLLGLLIIPGIVLITSKSLLSKRLLLFLIFILLGISAFAYLFPPAKSRIESIVSEPVSYNSANIRILEYASSLQIIKNNPLWGKGLETVYYTYPLYRSPELNKNEKEWFLETIQIRNFYLHLASTIGLIGLSVFLGIMAIFILSFINFLKTAKISHATLLLLGLFSAWLLLAIHYLFYGATVTSQIFFWGIMGILMGNIKNYQNRFLKPRNFAFSVSSATIKTASVAGILFFGLILVFFFRDLQSNIKFKQAIMNPNVDQALPIAKEAVSLNPLNTYYLQTYAFMNLRKSGMLLSNRELNRAEIEKLFQEAQQQLDLAKFLDPADPRLAHYRAILAYQKGRFTNPRNGYYHTPEFMKAVADSSVAHLLDPTSPMVLDLLTQVYLEMGGEKLIFAAEIARNTIRLKDTYSPAHYHLGEALKQMGRFDEAVQAYQEIFSYNPNDEFAKQEIENIKLLKVARVAN